MKLVTPRTTNSASNSSGIQRMKSWSLATKPRSSSGLNSAGNSGSVAAVRTSAKRDSANMRQYGFT